MPICVIGFLFGMTKLCCYCEIIEEQCLTKEEGRAMTVHASAQLRIQYVLATAVYICMKV